MNDLVIRGGSIVDGTGAPAFTADVAISDDRIVGIGRDLGPAKRTLDAQGAVVAPGWVDIHTHYDGQVTWDDQMVASASNGVTTVVMGNCGVGFAPVAKGGVQTLIELMEGVEDIPGSALHEGMPWGAWETFGEYLDVLDKRTYSLDIAAQLAHGALRYYAMGERGAANEDATAADLARMAAMTEEAMRAGAVGFSTSRTIGHRSITGVPVPGTFAAAEELHAIAAAMTRAGHGVFEAIASGTVGVLEPLGGEHATTDAEIELFADVSARSGRPLTFTCVQINEDRDGWRRMLDASEAANAVGAQLHPQVACRSVGFLTSLQAYHAFMRRPTYIKLAQLSLAERVAVLARPEIKEAILAEKDVPNDTPGGSGSLSGTFRRAVRSMYRMTSPIDYEPERSSSVAARAEAVGRDPLEFLYDEMLEEGGRAFFMLVGSNYGEGNLNTCREMLLDRNTVSGLSDAGAHVNFICDVSMPTFHLTHWVRDRVRGERLPIEHVVQKQTQATASLYGMTDRGVLSVGRRADINVIDLDALRIHVPEVLHDLPAGGSRVIQRSSGYLATIVAGAISRENDADTGLRSGRLVRGGRLPAAR